MVANRRGIPITLSVLFSAVLKRLGVPTQFLNAPSHLYICWADGSQWEVLDAFRGGEVARVEQQLRDPVMTAQEVVERMQRNLALLWHNAADIQRHRGEQWETRFQPLQQLRLASALLGKELDSEGDAGLRYFHALFRAGLLRDALREGRRLFQDNAEFVEKLEREADEYERRVAAAKATPPKLRRDDSNAAVLYGVGMVMQHRRYDYVCVIRGWDAVCALSEDWQIQMGVAQLPHGAAQPFYHVLANDASDRYAAQENLIPITQPTLCSHPDRGGG